MNIRRITGMVTLGLLLVACNGATPGPRTGVTVEGFKPFPSARSFDKPGRIYRVDPEGHVFKVGILEVEPQKGQEVLPKMQGKSELSLGQIFDTVGLNPVGISGSLRNNFQKKQEFVTESVNGQREFIDDIQVDPLLKKTFDNLVIRPTNKYFLIRETILSDQLKYKSGKSVFVDASVKAEFKRLVEAEASVKWDDSEEFSLDKTFEKPLRIWYKPELIEFKNDSRGALSPQVSGITNNEFVIPGDVPLEP